MDKKILGKNIKRIREQKGIALKDLAESCSVHKYNFETFEKGQFAPNETVLKRIAYNLDVDIDELRGTKKKALADFTTQELLDEVNRRL